MNFVVPIHAVDLELEKPDRFCVIDVWEVADEPTADVVAALEGARPDPNRHRAFRRPFTPTPRLCVPAPAPQRRRSRC